MTTHRGHFTASITLHCLCAGVSHDIGNYKPSVTPEAMLERPGYVFQRQWSFPAPYGSRMSFCAEAQFIISTCEGMALTALQFSLSTPADKCRRMGLFFYKQSILRAYVQFKSRDNVHASAPRQRSHGSGYEQCILVRPPLCCRFVQFQEGDNGKSVLSFDESSARGGEPWQPTAMTLDSEDR